MSNDTQTLTLSDFLLARIAEDEADWISQWNDAAIAGTGAAPCITRALAKCKADRRIVAWHDSWPVLVESPLTIEDSSLDTPVDSFVLRASRQVAWLTQREYVERFGTDPPTAPILLMLAQPYADHPDFRDEWRA